AALRGHGATVVPVRRSARAAPPHQRGLPPGRGVVPREHRRVDPRAGHLMRRPRWSTILLAIVFAGTTVLYFAVRPEPPPTRADRAIREQAEEIARFLSTTSTTTSTVPDTTTTTTTPPETTAPTTSSVPADDTTPPTDGSGEQPPPPAGPP